MLDTHQSIRSVIDLKSQCIFNLIELHTPSNTDNIFPIKIIDNSSSDFIKQTTACLIFFQKIARISETLAHWLYESSNTLHNKALTLEPAILSKRSYLER